jgi:1-acyl-sn-glycerol-3-phosphate acyltransferase
LENVPKDHGVLFLFNHQSHFDILSIHASQFRRMRFGAKIELFKFPFFGSAMRLSGVLPIARENREEVLQVYRDAQKKFAEGWSFILAPEGTRQSKPEIGRFKKGPFLFAIAAQVPIVPIVIKGADQILSKGGIWINMGVWSRTIEMRYLAPIETRGLTNADLGALTEQVREIFVKAYAEIPQPQAII